MDVLTRLKNTVTNAMPGNPVTREFEILGHRASAGPGLLWKVYDGLKRTTKQEVSVFVFEKKLLDRYSKHDKEIIIDVLRKGVSQLTRLRHPRILSVLHPLEESRESLAFATEPVFASLANVLGNTDNAPSPLPSELKGYQLYDVEIKYGLLQVTEALTFLHNSVKLIHGNLCPTSIMINKNGSWKIAGFDFCIRNANSSEQEPYYPFKEWDPGAPPVAQPQLDYLAPEYTLSMSCDTASDMFPLGVLFYACYNQGKTLFNCHNEYSSFKRNVDEIRNLRAGILVSVPDEVREHVKLLLNTEPTVRPDADQLSKIAYFEDVGAMTLQYLDSLMQRDNLQKSQFFKGLPKVISKMPKRVCLQRVLTCLFKEAINPEMIPFLLPNVLLIAEQATNEEYSQLILPGLVPIFKMTEPIQISLIFLQNMNLLLSKTPQTEIQNHVLPMVYRALECPMVQIQELCLSIIPTFASLIDYSAMKNALVPRIRKVCLGTASLKTRVNSLVCLGKLLEYMDKWYVLDEVFPILQEIPSPEPAVLMSILGIYKVTMSHKKLGITKEILANRILPFIIPLAVDNNINLRQFNAFMAVIHEMVEKVESEHRTKLEQLHSIQQEQRSLQFTTEPVKEANALVPGFNSESKQETLMDKFMSGFGMMSYFSDGSSSKSEDVAKSAKSVPQSTVTVTGPAPTLNNIPLPASSDTRLPNQPAKVNLSMAEKQRLAREAENQQRLKTQQPLTVKPSSAPASKSSMKDLSSTLMNTHIIAPPKSSVSSTSGMGLGHGGFRQSNSSTGGVFSSVGGMNSNGSSIMAAGMSQGGPPTLTPGGGFGTAGAGFQTVSQPKKNIDLSAFDNLLPSSTHGKKPMNQMIQPPQPMGGGFVGQPIGGGFGIQPQPMGMGGTMGGMMVNPGMMGNPRMPGVQPMGGGGFIQPQGMMGQVGGGMRTGGNIGVKPKSDFDDLFG